jgi:small-conductance mechanosensitive channel
VSRLWIAFLLVVSAAALWLLHILSLDFNLFGWSAIPTALLTLAWIATALFVVFAIGHLILWMLLTGFLGVEPSGLQRGIVFSVLTFAATAAVLARFGVDIGSILTTSALLAAVVGLAMRSIIGGMIAGSTLNMDRLLRVGDAILQSGQTVRVLSLNWRSITGRKPDGATVVLPYATISENTIEILPGDCSVRSETFVSVPAGVPPQRVSELIAEVVSDFAQIDFRQPISVALAGLDADKGWLKYTVRYWVRHYSVRTYVEGEVLRRIWYAFQRERIPCLGPNLDEELRRINNDNLRSASEMALRKGAFPLLQSAPPDVLTRAIAEGELLLYAAGERIVLPGRLEGCKFLLVDGELRESAHDLDRSLAAERSAGADAGEGSAFHITRRIALAGIADNLAQYIGPYARLAIEWEAARTADLNAICAAVANEIEDPAAKEKFLRETHDKQEQTFEPGFTFGARRDLFESLVSDPLMRAVGRATLLSISAEVLSHGEAAPARATSYTNSLIG